MKCPKCITNLASAIYNQSNYASGLERIFASVQRSRIQGIHILRFSDWTAGGFVSGPHDCCWLFDNKGLDTMSGLGPHENYDAISSPFPRLAFCKLDERKYRLNYTAGPRAARSLVALEVFRDRTVCLEVSEDDPMWIA